MSPIRPIDRWFINEVLPHEAAYLRLALRMSRSRDEAEDLVQDAYVRLFGLDGWAAIDQPQAYVLRSVRHIAIDRLRRAKIVNFQQLIDADHADLADDSPDAFDIVAAREGVRRFSDALAHLPARCREVFVRRRIQGQAPLEIAKALGVSVSTLEKRLARAFYLLAEQGMGAAPGVRSKADSMEERIQKG